MKKSILKLSLIIIVFIVASGKLLAQNDDGSKIFFISKTFTEKQSAEIFLNNRSIGTITKHEFLECNLISTGRLEVEIVINSVSTYYKKINVELGKTYYFKIDMWDGNHKLIDSLDGLSLMAKKTNHVKFQEDESDPIVKRSDLPKSGKGQGTCFLISDKGYFITNYHCIENAKEVTIKGIDEDFTTKYTAIVVATDPTNDLALLKINNKNVRFDSLQYGIKTTGVNQAEKVYALGFPSAEVMGTELKITDGIISAKSGAQGDISKYQISAPVNPGNSGGPLIDENGDLIGVIYAKSKIAEAAGYAIKASYLDLFLKNVEGFEMPVLQNKIKNKPLTDKVAYWKKNIFIVETN